MSDELIDIRWEFFGFESAEEGKPIDDWWNSLPEDSDDHRGLIKDILSQLQVTPRDEWEEPFFDPLIGEDGISEIRFIPPIISITGEFHYRIYGFFEEEQLRYTFLHATNKPRRNDKNGKAIAKRRLHELVANQAAIYPIDLD
jgi:hypothetical protein